MLKKLYPKDYLNSIFEIDADFLSKRNLDTIIFDIDNTLVPYYIKEPEEKLINHIEMLKKNGIKVALLSNNNIKRVSLFNEKLKIDAVHRATKPLTKKLRSLILKLGSNPNRTALAGDQIFTDVWCANKAGIYSILIKPVVEKDEWITKIKRSTERKIIDMYLKDLNKKER